MRPLMAHQQDALAYAHRTRHPALWMEMRTGKSLVAIRRCTTGRVLVVAPNPALPGWEDELAREGIAPVRVRGTREERLALLAGPGRWYLLNYEGWRVVPEVLGRERCSDCNGKGCGYCGDAGHLPGDHVLWEHLILDESTKIKNPRARVTQFFLKYARTVSVHRWILTGTPRPESDLDYFCQLAFLDGRALGCSNYWQFRNKWFDECGYTWTPRAGLAELVRETVAARAYVCSRRDARMPDTVVHQTRWLELPAYARRTYLKAEREFVLGLPDGTELSTLSSGAKWQWLRQLCGGYTQGHLAWAGKLNELQSLLTGELADEPVVVWFAYNCELLAAQQRLQAAGVSTAVIYGGVATLERDVRVRRWQRGDTRVLLAQQAVAQFGMDLSTADTAVFYSRHASGQINTQSGDRIVHPRKDWPLLHLDLCVKDTVDQDVKELVAHKTLLSRAAIDRGVLERMRARHKEE